MQWECRGGGEYLRNDKKIKWCSDFTFGRVWCGGLCGLQTLLFAVRVATASDAIISVSIPRSWRRCRSSSRRCMRA